MRRIAAAALVLAAGCGSDGYMSSEPAAAGSTNVQLVTDWAGDETEYRELLINGRRCIEGRRNRRDAALTLSCDWTPK